MIYVKAARKAYNNGIIDYLIFIRRKHNLSDALTKFAILPEFWMEFISARKTLNFLLFVNR